MALKDQLEDRIVKVIRDRFIQYADEVVDKYRPQITSTVNWYVSTLPMHIRKSEAEDLAQEAKIAFIDALKTWDPRRGELWPYVSLRLKGSMQDYLRKKKMDQISGMYEWINSAAHVYMAFNREAIVHDQADDIIHVDVALRELTDREKMVVEMYYKQDKTFREIGDEIGLSESQVSRICNEATRRMKKAMKKD